MKSIGFSIATILLSVSLTSCWSREEPTGTPLAQNVPVNNIVYLHTLVTRGQDATTIFQDMLKSGNIMVDFYADWCNPCKIMGRTIDQVAAQFPSVTFLKVNIDQFPTIAAQIQSIPTVVLYKDGAQLTRFSGVKDKKSLIDLLKKWY